MKVLIYGAGAVGLGIASCLIKAGCQCDLICSRQTAEQLHQNGLFRTGIFGTYSAPPGSFNPSASLSDLPPDCYDFILVCTKSHSSQAAAQDIAQYCKGRNWPGIIVLFQNGWGNADIFSLYMPKQRIFNARVITGFHRPKPNHVDITVHADAIHVGSLFGYPAAMVKSLAECISSGDIPCSITAEIEKDLWAKMLYNCALNPLGAILNVTYGALAMSPHTSQIMNTIIEEIYRVIQAAGFQTHWNSAEQYKTVFYEKLVPPTASHYSSTLQDLKAGKKTEIDALTGQILHLAAQYRIPVPYNSAVFNLVQFLQEKNTAANPE